MIYIKRLCAWAPGITDGGQWKEWAQGKREISAAGKGPDITFTEPMFRRRLSRISKMTIQAAHDLLPVSDDTKFFFFSFRGEIARQFQINKMLTEENALSPAAFSLSVFNAPMALAAIALGLKGGYSCIYPKENSFTVSISVAKAALFGGNADEIAFIYADEETPAEYEKLTDYASCALSFGLLLSKNKENNVPLPAPDENETPLSYLKKLLAGGINVAV